MNLHEVDGDDTADILARSTVLTRWQAAAGFVVHVVEYAGNDALVICNTASRDSLVIESDDKNYGGSIHDLVRAARDAGTL